MIIDEYKSDSTIIRIDDRDIGTKEENKEIIDILLSLRRTHVKTASQYFTNIRCLTLLYTEKSTSGQDKSRFFLHNKKDFRISVKDL